MEYQIRHVFLANRKQVCLRVEHAYAGSITTLIQIMCVNPAIQDVTPVVGHWPLNARHVQMENTSFQTIAVSAQQVKHMLMQQQLFALLLPAISAAILVMEFSIIIV